MFGRLATLLVVSSVTACVGAIGGNEERRDRPTTTTTEEPLFCDTSRPATIGPAPLRRLTRTELRNTLRDLFAGVAIPDVELPSDSTVDGFENNETAQTASPVLVEGWSKAALRIANAVSGKIVTCTDAKCARTFVESFVTRAYRRPLKSEEVERYTAFVVTHSAKHGFDGAISMLVEAVLQSPSFLYRPEEGAVDPTRPDALALTGHELAARLSYLLWQTMPDQTLFDAASAGELGTREGVETHARRLLADPRSRLAIADFHRQWLQLDSIETMRRDTTLFPAFTDATPAALRDATSRFVDHQFWNGSFEGLLSEPKAFVNDLIAPLYGVPKPGSATPVLIDVDPSQRAGLLTQAGFLASKAHEKFDAPILRGVFVLERFLCAPPPPPPPNVADIPPPESGDTPRTTRQRIEQSHASTACRGCHDTIHGVGFLFNNYDAVGAWRTHENGIAVDSTGGVTGLGDVDGKYDNAVALTRAMSKSERVQQCFSRQWFRFAYGRTETKADGCTVQALTNALRAGKGNMREMLVQLVLADAFRARPTFVPVSVKAGE